MNKSEIEPGIIKYTFNPQFNRHFGFNILALIDNDRVALLDTGYEEHIKGVIEDLNNNGLKVDTAFISHFHSDHIYGLKKLPDIKIYGSSLYKETINMYEEKEDHEYFIPTFSITEIQEIVFGEYKLTLIPSPGHSACTMLIMINDRYLHIADEMMFSNLGEHLLPSTEGNSVKRHLDSLKRLLEYKDYTLIPGHGPLLSEKNEVLKSIENRIAYLEAVLKAGRRISYEEASRNCEIEFLHKEWHESLYN